MLVLLFCLPTGAFAEGLYTKLTASVPVSFMSASGQNGCTAVMETINGSPEPHQSEITLSSSGTDEFKIDVTEPGTYRYKVYERAGTDSSVKYDDTVYTVTLFVTTSTDTTLKYAVVAATDKSDEKPDKVEFVHERGIGENDDDKKDDDKDPPKTDDRDKPSSTTDDSGRSSSGGKSTPLNGGKVTVVTDNPSNPDNPDDPDEPSDNTDNTDNTDNSSSDNDDNSNVGVISSDDSDIGTDSKDSNIGDAGNLVVTDKTDEQITTETAVNTGDRNRQSLWLAIMCASLAVVVISTLAEKRYKKITH